MGIVINKKPPVLVDGFAYVVIDSVSKAALVDLVSDFLRLTIGREDASDEEMAACFVERMDPVVVAREDKPINVAKLRAEYDRHQAARKKRLDALVTK